MGLIICDISESMKYLVKPERNNKVNWCVTAYFTIKGNLNVLKFQQTPPPPPFMALTSDLGLSLLK